MDRTYSDRQLRKIIDGDFMPREQALARQCLDIGAEAKAARESNWDDNQHSSKIATELLLEVESLKAELKAAREMMSQPYHAGQKDMLERAISEISSRSMNVSGGVCFDFGWCYNAPGTIAQGIGDTILNRIEQNLIEPLRQLPIEDKPTTP